MCEFCSDPEIIFPFDLKKVSVCQSKCNSIICVFCFLWYINVRILDTCIVSHVHEDSTTQGPRAACNVSCSIQVGMS